MTSSIHQEPEQVADAEVAAAGDVDAVDVADVTDVAVVVDVGNADGVRDASATAPRQNGKVSYLTRIRLMMRPAHLNIL